MAGVGGARSVLQPELDGRRRGLRVAALMDGASEAVLEAGTPAARSQVATHAGITFAGLMGANVLGYVFYALVSGVLGSEAYGTFSSLVALVLILMAPARTVQKVVATLASDFCPSAERLAPPV